MDAAANLSCPSPGILPLRTGRRTKSERIKTEHGNESIFAGSYGWASAGRFHHANTLVKRFFNCYGGFTDHVTTYSIAAGYVILPPRHGGFLSPCAGHITTWDSIAQDSGLFVMFGGVPVKNAQVAAGGAGEHSLELWLERAKANTGWNS